MKSNKKQAEINELLAKLQKREDGDRTIMTAELKELRHHVMHIHYRLEYSMGYKLAIYLLLPFDEALPRDTLHDLRADNHSIDDFMKTISDNYNNFVARFSQVIEGIDFVKKLNALQRIGGIKDEEYKLLHKVNWYRIIFSHPQAYKTHIKELRNLDKYYEVLITLIKAYEVFDINQLFRETVKKYNIKKRGK